MSQGAPYNRTLRKGENDQTVPWYKRRDSYGEKLNPNPVGMDVPNMKGFVKGVDSGSTYLDAGERDEAQMHADSLRGSNDATSRAIEEINRRLDAGDASRRKRR